MQKAVAVEHRDRLPGIVEPPVSQQTTPEPTVLIRQPMPALRPPQHMIGTLQYHFYEHTDPDDA